MSLLSHSKVLKLRPVTLRAEIPYETSIAGRELGRLTTTPRNTRYRALLLRTWTRPGMLEAECCRRILTWQPAGDGNACIVATRVASRWQASLPPISAILVTTNGAVHN